MSGLDASWRELSQADRETEYSPSSRVGGNIDEFLDAYARHSADARDECATIGATSFEIRYGTAPSQTIDVATPQASGQPTPLVVFLHGGYWQALSKSESFFAAADSIKHNVAFAAVDYTLAPMASLDEIVDECHAALGALRDAASEHGIDPDRIVVCGSSAGGHLAAMVGLGSIDGWRPAAVGLISGIFELEPIIGTSINDAVQLDVTSAVRNSPILAELHNFPPAVIAYGDNETSEFKRQSDDMASALRDAGREVRLIEVDSRNHFDLVLDLADDETILGQHILNLIDQTASTDRLR